MAGKSVPQAGHGAEPCPPEAALEVRVIAGPYSSDDERSLIKVTVDTKITIRELRDEIKRADDANALGKQRFAVLPDVIAHGGEKKINPVHKTVVPTGRVDETGVLIKDKETGEPEIKREADGTPVMLDGQWRGAQVTNWCNHVDRGGISGNVEEMQCMHGEPGGGGNNCTEIKADHWSCCGRVTQGALGCRWPNTGASCGEVLKAQAHRVLTHQELQQRGAKAGWAIYNEGRVYDWERTRRPARYDEDKTWKTKQQFQEQYAQPGAAADEWETVWEKRANAWPEDWDPENMSEEEKQQCWPEERLCDLNHGIGWRAGQRTYLVWRFCDEFRWHAGNAG